MRPCSVRPQAALEPDDSLRLMPLREGTFGLALALQAQGRPGEADAVVDRLSDALLRTANAGELAWVGAFRVRLALRRGELAPRLDAELGVGVAQVDLHGLLRDPQRFGDPPVGLARRRQVVIAKPIRR